MAARVSSVRPSARLCLSDEQKRNRVSKADRELPPLDQRVPPPALCRASPFRLEDFLRSRSRGGFSKCEVLVGPASRRMPGGRPRPPPIHFTTLTRIPKRRLSRVPPRSPVTPVVELFLRSSFRVNCRKITR